MDVSPTVVIIVSALFIIGVLWAYSGKNHRPDDVWSKKLGADVIESVPEHEGAHSILVAILAMALILSILLCLSNLPSVG